MDSEKLERLIERADEILFKHFGYTEYRTGQREAVINALAGNDLLAVMATGSGKSVCFQVPALIQKGLHIVVTPLIALMRDQVSDCRRRGIPADEISSSRSSREEERVYAAAEAGEVRLLYVSPEKLLTKNFYVFAAEQRVRSVIVDEAHCSSKSVWGLTFRPEYSKIHAFVNALPKRPRVACYTATCTDDIEADIVRATGMSVGTYARIITDPVRPNLTYRTVRTDKAFNEICELASNWKLKDGRYIIYTHSRKATEMLRNALVDQIARITCPGGTYSERESYMATAKEVLRPQIAAYHAGMGHGDTEYVYRSGHSRNTQGRRSVQDDFKSGKIRIIVATEAFGMGTDVPDVREIIEMGMPRDLKSYAQMSGRAGRDGKPSVCTVVMDDRAEQYTSQSIDNDFPKWAVVSRVILGLLEMLGDAEEESKTIHKLAKRLSESKAATDSVGVSLPALESSLNLLVSLGFIQRETAGRGWEVSFNVKACRDYMGAGKNPMLRRVVTSLMELMDGDTTNRLTLSQGQLEHMASSELSGGGVYKLIKSKSLIKESNPVTLTETLVLLRPLHTRKALTYLSEVVTALRTHAVADYNTVVGFLNAADVDKVAIFRSYFSAATVD